VTALLPWPAIVGLVASVAVIAIGAFIVMKRPEVNSLFVEDRFGFVLVKIVIGVSVIALGGLSFLKAFSVLLSN
jgi:hypothetical protein